MDRRVTHLQVNRSLNCVLEVVQCIYIIISDQPLLLFFFQLKRENRVLLFSNPVEVNY